MLDAANQRVDVDEDRNLAELFTLAHALEEHGDACSRELNDLAVETLEYIFRRMETLDANQLHPINDINRVPRYLNFIPEQYRARLY